MNSLSRRALLGNPFAVSSALAAPSPIQKRIEWRMVTTWPANFPGMGTGVKRLAETIHRLSQGRLTITVYGAGELVPAFEAIDAVANGSVEMGHGAPYYWKGKIPAAQFLAALPFGLTAQEQNAWLYFGGGLALAETIYADLGCRFFPAGNTGVQMGGWFNRKITSLDDFQGLKIRMPGLGGEVVKAAGATVVNLPGSDILTALQSGNIDAAEWIGPYNDLAFGLYQAAQYYYSPGWHEPAVIFDCFVNAKAYDSLPADLQSIVKQACQAANQDILSEFTARNSSAFRILKDQHKVTTLAYPDTVLKALGRLSSEVLGDLANQDTLSRQVYQSVIDFRSRAQKWSNISGTAYLKARQIAIDTL